jgi:hypothetical protein
MIFATTKQERTILLILSVLLVLGGAGLLVL